MKRVLSSVGLILFGILTAVIAAEVAARILAAQGTIPNRLAADIFIAHPIGWAMEPNAKVTIPTYGGLISIETNEIGYRDANYPLQPAEDRTRLLILGDSYTAAIETPQQQTFHTQLEMMYQSSVEVISIAASGYQTQQEVMAYVHAGHNYQPDEVLLMMYVGNDLTGNGPRDPLPYYALNADQSLTLKNYPYSGEFSIPTVAGEPSTPLMRLSHLTFLIGLVQQSWGSQSPDAAQTADDGQPAPAEQSAICEFEQGNNYAVVGQEDWAITEALLLELRRRVEADGATLKIAVIPMEFQIESEHEQDFLTRCGEPDLTGWVEPQERLLDFLEAEGFDYLDLRPALLEARSDEPLYFANFDNHWTPAGHLVAARALFGWLNP